MFLDFVADCLVFLSGTPSIRKMNVSWEHVTLVADGSLVVDDVSVSVAFAFLTCQRHMHLDVTTLVVV